MNTNPQLSLRPSTAGAFFASHPEFILRVLQFAYPLAAFDGRLVCRAWNDAVNNGSSTFWRHIVAACLPWCDMTLQLLDHAAPKRYFAVRHFSKMSLSNMKTLQHVMICDVTNHPLLWFTNVAVSTPVELLYDAVAATLFEFLDAHEISLVAAGVPLDRTKRIEDHRWPVRGGKRGWRLDMLIIVRGFHYSFAPSKPRAIPADVFGPSPLDVPDAPPPEAVAPKKQLREGLSNVAPIDFLQFVEGLQANIERAKV